VLDVRSVRAAARSDRQVPLILWAVTRRLPALVAGGICLALAALLAGLVGTGAINHLDRSIGRDLLLSGHTSLQAARLVENVFGLWPMIVLTLLLAGGAFAKGYHRAGYYFIGVNLVGFVLSPLIKHMMGRHRPPYQLPTRLTDGSFPSGHALHAATFFGACIVLAMVFWRKQFQRRTAVGASVIAVLLVSCDRLWLGRHYPSDVLAGVLLGAAIVLIGLFLYSPVPRSHAEHAEPLPYVFAERRTCAVVLNPSKVENVRQFRTRVDELAVERGWNPPTWYLTTVEDPGTGMAEQAAIEGAELVMVCGGDGTVREVCAELAGTGIPVGIIPAGTGNLLARNLGIPLFLNAAVDVALTGQDRAIDMVTISGDNLEDSSFLVMAGMGFDAAMIEGADEELKRKIGWVAYVLSALKALMYPAVRVEISVDAGPFTKHRARTIVIGNVGTLQAGMPLLPDAEIDDGLLDVVLLYPQRFLSWLPLAWRILLRRPQSDDLVHRMTGRSITIRADRDTPRQLDGDLIGPGRELHASNVHGRLLVRVPR
jgi:YegS/Rv2252/BmrU family lipid kinase